MGTLRQGLIWLLAIAMLATACGGSDDTSDDAAASDAASSETTSTEAEETDEAEPTEVPEATAEPEPEPTEAPEPESDTAPDDEPAEADGDGDDATAPADEDDAIGPGTDDIPDPFDDVDANDQLDFLLSFALGVPDADLPAARACLVDELTEADITLDEALASTSGGAVSIAGIRCAEDPAGFMFQDGDFEELRTMSPDEARCAADAFIDGLRAVPLQEADAFMDSEDPPPELLDGIAAECGLNEEQILELVTG